MQVFIFYQLLQTLTDSTTNYLLFLPLPKVKDLCVEQNTIATTSGAEKCCLILIAIA